MSKFLQFLLPLLALPLAAIGQVNIGGDTAICSEIAPYKLFANPPGGKWSGSPTVNLSIDTGRVLSNGGILNPRRGLGTFTITYTLGSGTGAQIATKKIKVIDAPIADAGKDTSQCSGSPGKIIGKPGKPGLVYHWTRRGKPTNTLSNDTAAMPIVTLTNSDSIPYQVFYYLEVTDTFTGCSAFDSVTVTVYKPTNFNVILPKLDTLKICGTDPPFLLPIPHPGGGFWTGTGVTNPQIFGGTFNPSPALEGEVTIYYVQPCNTPISVYPAIVKVRVPHATAMPDFSICANADSAQLIGQPGGGIWSGPAGISPKGKLVPDTGFTGVRKYIYTTYSGKPSCFATDTTQVTFRRFPKVKASTDVIICANAPAKQLVGFSPANGQFTCQNCLPTNSPVLNGSTITPSKRNSGTWVIRYTKTDSGCTAFRESNVTIQPVDSVFAGPDTSVCSNGTPFNLTKYGPPNGIWVGQQVDNFGKVTPRPTVTGFYNLTYRATSTNGCIGTDTLRIQYKASPGVPVAAKDTAVCGNSPSFNILGSTPAGGHYFNAAGLTAAFGIDTSKGSFTPSRRLVGVQKIYYVVRTPLGCIAKDSMNIDVRPLPEANAGLDFNVCSDADSLQIGSDPQINQPPNLRFTYSWTGAQGTSGFSSIIRSNPIVKFFNNDSKSITNTYYLKVTRLQTGFPTCFNQDTLKVSIFPKPTAQIQPNFKEKFCEGDSVTLRAKTGPRLIYQWISTGTPFNPVPTLKDSLFVVHRTGRYYLRIVDTIPVRGSACSDTSNSDSIYVKKRNRPSIAGQINYCVKSKDSLKAVPSGVGLNYQWLRDGGIIGGARDSVFRTGIIGNYRVVITDPRNGVVCYDTSNAVSVDSIPLPYNDLVKNGNDTTFSVCSQNVPLTLKGPIDPRLPLAFKYKWQDGNTGRIYTIDTIGKYYLSVYNECGNFTDTLRLASIVPTPKFKILHSGFRDTTVCKDFPFTISGPEGYFYRWYYQLPSGTVDSVTSTQTIVIKTNEVTEPETRFVRLRVGSPLGCFYTDTIRYQIVYCDPIVQIPTAFTPQGDGKNETWALKIYSVTAIKVSIYDRWGQMVYYAPDLATATSRPWDGTYNGLACTPSSYKYIIDYEGLAPNQTDVLHVRKTGNVTLIR